MRNGAILAEMMVVLAQAIPIAALPLAVAAGPPKIALLMEGVDARLVDDLPRLRSLLFFEPDLGFSSFHTLTVCCPARASVQRGQYPHDTGVLENGPPHGGLAMFGKEMDVDA